MDNQISRTKLDGPMVAQYFSVLVFWMYTRQEVDEDLYLTWFDWLRVVTAVLRLAHIQGGHGRYHQYLPTQEREDTRQGQGLRTLFIWSDIGKSVCERVRVRTRARFQNCILLLSAPVQWICCQPRLNVYPWDIIRRVLYLDIIYLLASSESASLPPRHPSLVGFTRFQAPLHLSRTDLHLDWTVKTLPPMSIWIRVALFGTYTWRVHLDDDDDNGPDSNDDIDYNWLAERCCGRGSVRQWRHW